MGQNPLVPLSSFCSFIFETQVPHPSNHHIPPMALVKTVPLQNVLTENWLVLVVVPRLVLLQLPLL